MNAIHVTVAILTMLCLCTIAADAGPVTTRWGGDAGFVYDNGFMRNLMHGSDGNVRLFNMDLIENDAPGSGKSEHGVYSDIIWGDVRGRKVLHLDDPHAEKAWIVIFIYNGFTNPNFPKHSLKFSVNGNESEIRPWDIKKVIETYRWVEFPASWLKKGENVFDLYCPEAKSPEEGWELYIARAEDFPSGGGDPGPVGETSFKSFNGGKSWQKSPFGPDRDVKAEYTVRLSLDRYVDSGWLATPVIDLWQGDSDGMIIPQREIRSLRVRVDAETPDGTEIVYSLRRGRGPSPYDTGWEEYREIGRGSGLDVTLEGAELNRRYVQLRMGLSTDDPLVSPVIKEVSCESELFQRVTVPSNIHVVHAENDPIAYSSLDWRWEPWDRPEFDEVIARENLDEVVAGSRTQFDAQVKILDYVAKRWKWGVVTDNYPTWDALSILERVDNLGWGGMCALFNNTIGGMCMAYGWQARMINVVAHEVIEVWNDDYGKWVMLDGAFDPDNENTYQYDPETAEPLNMLELHQRYLDYYFPDGPIDWMNDFTGYQNIREDDPPPVRRGTLTPERPARHTGFITAAFMRMVPRNNWYEQPTPHPLDHGTSWWPWDGYVNWYDDRTPPKRQYSQYTDRPRDLWPDLNKVCVHATSGFGNDRLYLRFETYTPGISHFEVNVDGTGWKEVPGHWTWLLQAGRNRLKARTVTMRGAKGKPSVIELNHANAPFGE